MPIFTLYFFCIFMLVCIFRIYLIFNPVFFAIFVVVCKLSPTCA